MIEPNNKKPITHSIMDFTSELSKNHGLKGKLIGYMTMLGLAAGLFICSLFIGTLLGAVVKYVWM